MKGKNTTKFRNHMRQRLTAQQKEQNFKTETLSFIRGLPRKNLSLTINNHKMFVNMIALIKNSVWHDPEAISQCEELLKKEEMTYVKDLQTCRKRLGYKTTQNTTTLSDIHWLG